jgi:hypothetical protein
MAGNIRTFGNSYFIVGYPESQGTAEAYNLVPKLLGKAKSGQVAIEIDRQELLEFAVKVLADKLLEQRD